VIGASIAWRVLAGALVASLVWGGWQWIQLQNAERTILTMELAWSTSAVEQIRSARTRERELQAHADKVAADYEQARQLADRDQARTVADLRAGRERFRRMWQGCQADTMRVRTDPEPAGQPDGGAEDRAESAGRVVRAARDCDNQVRGLQDYIRGLMR
jgi:hypothetical protein